MNALQTLKSACKKKFFKGFKEIANGEYTMEYTVKRFTSIDTNYGPRIRMDMGDFYMVLPERIGEDLTVADLESLNKAPKLMIYYGRDTADHNRILIDFFEKDDHNRKEDSEVIIDSTNE